MSYEHIKVWEEGPVTVVALNRPEKGNAISKRMAEEVQAAMTAFAASDQRAAVLTAMGTKAFSFGADVTEPPELWRAVPNSGWQTDKPLIAFGRWRLDTTARHLLDAEGTAIALSGGEFRLLRVFLDHPQRVLSRDQLLNLTQGRDAEHFARSIDLLVSRLRQRLQDDARDQSYIKTVRSEGYVFSQAVTLVGKGS